jgi:DNA-binding GntR family transcriptional regulator
MSARLQKIRVSISCSRRSIVCMRVLGHAHNRFHKILTAGCQSRWLQHFAAMLRDQTARNRHLSVTTSR